MVSKFKAGLKTFLQQGLSEPEIYKSKKKKKKECITDFSICPEKLSYVRKRIKYIKNVMWQFACLVVNPVTVSKFAFIFNCITVGRASDSKVEPT